MNSRHSPPADAPVAGTYRHYKGGQYQVLGVARHSETEEWMVLYQALYAERGFWARPLTLWLEPVAVRTGQTDSTGSAAQATKGKTPVQQRFELVSPSNQSLNQLTKTLLG